MIYLVSRFILYLKYIMSYLNYLFCLSCSLPGPRTVIRFLNTHLCGDGDGSGMIVAMFSTISSPRM